LQPDLLTPRYSLQTIERLLHGMPAVPRLGFPFIDVRDVAHLHLRAMTEPAGRRSALHRRRPLPLAAKGRRDAA
jgi:nucleoside-diphosphate-sugar epimerase